MKITIDGLPCEIAALLQYLQEGLDGENTNAPVHKVWRRGEGWVAADGKGGQQSE